MCSFISLQVLGLAPTGCVVWMTIIVFSGIGLNSITGIGRFKLYHRSECFKFKLLKKKKKK